MAADRVDRSLHVIADGLLPDGFKDAAEGNFDSFALWFLRRSLEQLLIVLPRLADIFGRQRLLNLGDERRTWQRYRSCRFYIHNRAFGCQRKFLRDARSSRRINRKLVLPRFELFDDKRAVGANLARHFVIRLLSGDRSSASLRLCAKTTWKRF